MRSIDKNEISPFLRYARTIHVTPTTATTASRLTTRARYTLFPAAEHCLWEAVPTVSRRER